MIWGYVKEMKCPFLNTGCMGEPCSKFDRLCGAPGSDKEYGKCDLYVKIYIRDGQEVTVYETSEIHISNASGS